MRDIGYRIQRPRLSRLAPLGATLRHRLPWLWIVLAAWIAWAGLLSDHSLYRIWKLQRENARASAELARVEGEIHRLDRVMSDPGARRELGERALREDGGMAKPGEIVYKIRSSADSTRRR